MFRQYLSDNTEAVDIRRHTRQRDHHPVPGSEIRRIGNEPACQ
jgi:hypothetical protein